MNAARRWRTVRSSRGITPGMCTIRVNASLSPIQPVSGSAVVTVAIRGPVTQQGDLSDDRACGCLSDGHRAVGTDVLDFGGARRDQQERDSLLPLLHQHLAGRGAQRLNARRQRHQVLGRASLEDVHCREFFHTRTGQSGHCDIPPIPGLRLARSVRPSSRDDRFAMTSPPRVAVVYCASSGYEVGYGPGKDARAHVVMRTGLPER